MTGRATLWVKDGWIYVRTPYDRAFVDAFKTVVPPSDRRWDSAEKVWKAAAAWADEVEDVVTEYFGPPTVLEPEVVVLEAPAQHDAWSTMLRLAPDALLKNLYRQLVATHHPDRGGDPDRMVELNRAWAEISKERGL